MAEKRITLDKDRGIELRILDVSEIEVNDWNPNEMGSFEMNQLAKDLEERGFLQPILVVPKDDGKYMVVDGEHRFEAARLCDVKDIPAIVVTNDFLARDEDQQKFQTVRMNKLRGKINKRKFRALVEDLFERYPLDVLAEALVVEDEAYLEDLIKKTRESLPTQELKEAFDKAKEEVKTVDDLTILLQKLFSRYGETLDHGYMVLDYGGKMHLWVRLKSKADFETAKQVAEEARSRNLSFSDVIMDLLSNLDDEYWEDAEAILPKVNIEVEDDVF